MDLQSIFVKKKKLKEKRKSDIPHALERGFCSEINESRTNLVFFVYQSALIYYKK
jgi:hypothetical protein